jgi:hypothetical protein
MNLNMDGRWIVDVGAFLSVIVQNIMIKNPTEKEQEGKIVKLVCSILFSLLLIQKLLYKEVLWFVH